MKKLTVYISIVLALIALGIGFGVLASERDVVITNQLGDLVWYLYSKI